MISFVAAQGDAFELLEFSEEVLDEVAPFVDFGVDLERFAALWSLRDDDLGATLVQVVDDPVGIEGLV